MSQTETIEITPSKKTRKVVRKDLTEEDKKHLSLLNKVKKEKKLEDTRVIDEVKDRDYDYVGRGLLKAVLESYQQKPEVQATPVPARPRKDPRIVEQESDSSSEDEIIVIPKSKPQTKKVVALHPMPVYSQAHPEIDQPIQVESRYGKKEAPAVKLPERVAPANPHPDAPKPGRYGKK